MPRVVRCSLSLSLISFHTLLDAGVSSGIPFDIRLLSQSPQRRFKLSPQISIFGHYDPTYFQLTFALKTAIVLFFSQESVSRLFPRAGPSKCGIALLQPST
jgi:hypothetical protein